jgi:hypothetical protein
LNDDTYNGFPDSGLSTSPLLSPAHRRERGLPAEKSGVVVDQVAPGGTAFGVLRPGDVILEVEGTPVANDGSVRVADARVTFEHFFDMKQVGEEVKVKVFRDGREETLRAASRHIPRLENRRNRYGVAPRYVVYAGLVFMPLDTELLKIWGRGWLNTADRNLVWHHLFREAEDPASADREVVVLTRVLRHAANSQLGFSGPVAVDKINGVPIRSLSDVVSAFEGNKERFHRLEFEDSAGIEVLDRDKAAAAHAEILKQYAIPRDRNL